MAKVGYSPSLVFTYEQAMESVSNQTPDLILLEVSQLPLASGEIRHFLTRIKEEQSMPILALLSREDLPYYDFTLGIEDFTLQPCSSAEVIARVKQVLWRSSRIEGENIIKCSDLVIDLAKYKVSLSGRVVPLTYKEYELLKCLASNRGKAFNRDTLLNKVWGYDYYGGDRTVDVHIRRLRSKIEDRTHSFVETVRGVGYRFKE